MSNLSPIPSVLLDRPEQTSVQEWNQAILSMIRDLHDLTQTGTHRNSWGLTILRTVYTADSDVSFPLVVKRIDEYLRQWITKSTTPTTASSTISDLAAQSGEELLARLSHTILEDRQALDGATLEADYAAFQDWVQQNGDSESHNSRYRIALVIDQQSLDDTMKLPEAGSDVYYKEKLVSCCKGLTRWGIDRRQDTPWFYVAPALLASLWFSVMHQEMALKLTQISQDPPVFEMTTPLHRSPIWPAGGK
ncbi:hypothetical protein ISF_07994 [Cordyceps fumosorosea ARSEF 2679]|uniref:Uncharacterized protein n=1 Tax=Cordyceps fumosorosea (strain ARSEF 2679) TaxID=1081104 RepID=A0A167NEV0_CORFA|nr:hypothetical protein ISF_07994 [Cordyceps fumosorosea ARSEF 2679]OAA55483.1 hypothetical protein ISF_07994 [Cordyceps fumosorosea ARSEF 2679]